MSDEYQKKVELPELILKNDSLGVQLALDQILKSKLENAKKNLDLTESVEFINLSGDEYDTVSMIQAKSRGYGSTDISYMHGVAVVDFTSKKATEDFIEWIEDEGKYVEHYEVEVLSNDDGAEEVEDVDFDTIKDDHLFKFIVTVYLLPEIVDFNGSEAVYESDEQIEEGAVRKIRVNSFGIKSVKMQCQKGSKWNPARKTCEVIVGQELSNKRMAIKHAIITKRAGGQVFKRRMVRKMRKADRYRKMMGLK